MAVLHIKNIHNHKIKTGFRNDPLPPYFDGYIDTLSGKVVDPVSNVDTFLQSVKDEVDAKIGNIDSFISKSQLELDDSKTSIIDVVNSMTEAFNKNNEKIMSYIFESSQFGGKKEIQIVNNSEITPETMKFIKKVKIDVTYTPQRYCEYIVMHPSDAASNYGLLKNRYYRVVSIADKPDAKTITKLDPIVNEILPSKTFSVTLDFPWSKEKTTKIEFDDVFGYKSDLLIYKFDPEKREVRIGNIVARDYKNWKNSSIISESHYKITNDYPKNGYPGDLFSDPTLLNNTEKPVVRGKILTLVWPKDHPTGDKNWFDRENGKYIYSEPFKWFKNYGIRIAPKYTITLMSE